MLRYSTYQSIYDRKADSRNEGALRKGAARLNEAIANSISNIFARITLFKLLVFILFVVIAWAGMASAVASSPDHDVVESESVVVKRGDSLWKIAAAHKPGDMDTRVYVTAIQRVNGLAGSNIQPGDILVLPMK
ncbi:LysM peptidoglycan-binding domain-containing protein [Paenibacillus humicus]|uniref:LysM peptidoglycan-binding domain-containing protein n=1 Tax=Paenibacillus humicus TaxID=412861 RepID=UPI003D269EEC